MLQRVSGSQSFSPAQNKPIPSQFMSSIEIQSHLHEITWYHLTSSIITFSDNFVISCYIRPQVWRKISETLMCGIQQTVYEVVSSEQVTSSHSPHASSLEHFNWIQCFVSLQILHFASLDTLRHPAWQAQDCDIRFRSSRVTSAAPATEKGYEDLTKRTASGLQWPKNDPHFWVSSSTDYVSRSPPRDVQPSAKGPGPAHPSPSRGGPLSRGPLSWRGRTASGLALRSWVCDGPSRQMWGSVWPPNPDV